MSRRSKRAPLLGFGGDSMAGRISRMIRRMSSNDPRTPGTAGQRTSREQRRKEQRATEARIRKGGITGGQDAQVDMFQSHMWGPDGVCVLHNRACPSR